MIAATVALIAAPADAAERRYSVTDFDRIQVEGPFEVTLTTGRSGSATATGDVRAIDRLSLEVQGRTLRIRPNRSAWGGFPGEAGGGPLKIAVTTHGLRAASVNGSGSIAIDGAKGLRFDLTVRGSGHIGIAKVEADNLSVGLLGSGKIVLAGKAKELVATISGAGNLEAAGLTADEAKLTADTAGDISLGVRRDVEIIVTGQGDTHIVGRPSCRVKSLSSGRVVCGS
jgi:hypothetical protein